MLRITPLAGEDGETVLLLAGRVTAAELPSLREALVASTDARIVLDLGAVSYADAAGVEALIALDRRRFALKGPRGFVRRMLEEVAR